MADPIKHDTASAMSTAGWEAGKGVLKGAGLVLAVGAALGALGGALLIGGAAAVIGGAVLGFAATAVAGGPIIAAASAIGGLLGLSQGGSRITSENEAYRNKVEHRAEKHQQKVLQKLNDAKVAGMQEGYQVGYVEGQQKIVHDIQEQLIAQAQQEQQAKGGFAAKVTQRREEQALNPNQVG